MERKETIINSQKTYSFLDGSYTFWEGEVDGNIVVIRVRTDDKPGLRWVKKGLPYGITIHPAEDKHIQQWLENHPNYTLIN